MTTVIGGSVYWNDRFCIIQDDGCWALSRVGKYTDWDYAAPDDKGAIAGNCQARVTGCERIDKKGRTTVRLCPVDNDRLLIVQASGDVFVLTGNPRKGGRIDLLQMPPVEPEEEDEVAPT